MVEYNNIKDLIIWNDPIFGEISLDFIITGLQELLIEQSKFEDIISQIIKNTSKFDDADLVSLYSLSKIDTMNMYLKMIKDEL